MSLEIAAAAYIYINLASKKKKRRWWQTQLYHSRSVSGGSSLLNDLRGQEMSGQFNNFTRMHSDDYDLLLNLIGPKIARKNTVFREAISVQERLAVTLRFLATGDSYTSLQYLFKFSKQSISKIVPEVCEAIVEVLKHNIKVRIMILFIILFYYINCVMS
jgi:hypothetical protein